VDVLFGEPEDAAIEAVMQAYYRERGVVGRRNQDKKARMQKRAAERCLIGFR
jgi:hypothetical protein